MSTWTLTVLVLVVIVILSVVSSIGIVTVFNPQIVLSIFIKIKVAHEMNAWCSQVALLFATIGVASTLISTS